MSTNGTTNYKNIAVITKTHQQAVDECRDRYQKLEEANNLLAHLRSSVQLVTRDGYCFIFRGIEQLDSLRGINLVEYVITDTITSAKEANYIKDRLEWQIRG